MIRIRRLTDYGIVLLSCFAGTPGGTVRSARELADATGIPLPTVSKILKALTRAGLLLSHRGTQGGYSLTRRLEEVTVADVIGGLDGPIALTDCGADSDASCEILPTCPVRTNWQRIADAIRDALEAVPVSEMTVAFPLHHGALPGGVADALRAAEASPRGGPAEAGER